MTFKKHAALQLESFLNDEFKKKTPLLVVSDTCILYKSFKVKKNKDDMWEVWNDINFIGKFNLKACAVLAAKIFSQGAFFRLKEVKNLDAQYWQHSTDVAIFKNSLKKASDSDRKDYLTARLDNSKTRAAIYQQQIISMFKTVFAK